MPTNNVEWILATWVAIGCIFWIIGLWVDRNEQYQYFINQEPLGGCFALIAIAIVSISMVSLLGFEYFGLLTAWYVWVAAIFSPWLLLVAIFLILVVAEALERVE